jgi:hypothetical protein
MGAPGPSRRRAGKVKRAAIRKAASYRFQEREVDIDTMLAETEAGRLAEIEAGLAGADDT